MAIAGELGQQIMVWITTTVPLVNTLHPWAFFAAVLVTAVVLSQVFGYVFRVVIKAATSRTKTQADDILVHAIQQPISWLIFSVLAYVAFAPLSFGEGLTNFITSVLASINIVFIGWLVFRVVKAIFEIYKVEVASKTKSNLDDTVLPILSKFASAAVWILVAIFVVSAWGIEVGPFLAGLGIAGIAIGFAIKDSLANIFGGISLAFDHAYKVGDKVRLGGNIVGVVHDITLRSTRIERMMVI